MTERVTDLVLALERLEDDLGSLLREGRLFAYARALTRLVGWLRVQPRGRVVFLASVGAGVVAGLLILLGTTNRPVEESSEELPPDRDWG